MTETSTPAPSPDIPGFRRRLIHRDFVARRVLIYTLLTVLATTGYALLVSGLNLALGSVLRPGHPLIAGLVVFSLALAFNPVRLAVQQAVDRVFFHGQAVYRDRLEEFGHALTQAIELPAILKLLRQYVVETLEPVQVHLFVKDSLSDTYQAMPGESGRPTSDLLFAGTSVVVQRLARQNGAIFIPEARGPDETAAAPQAGLQPERARLALLGCALFVPLPGRNMLTGWLALGPRRSGEPYASRDLDFLEALCDQAALAVERAQVVEDLERRVREMNVLTRVAQGINYTLAFDDILELIFAQTSLVIPTRDFWITLLDEESQELVFAFCLEGDERLREREQLPLPAGKGLERELFASQRALITDDYERECRGRGGEPAVQGLYAWMGVPLTAQSETVGAISLGSRDPAATFTPEQCSLLQAIADQATGAIVKARLLEETQTRARQLGLLNEIGRSLTSTLELKPLLSRILTSATEILNCAAGSLLLLDEQTGELVFEVVIGPVAADLTGMRLPPGTGLAGEAVSGGQPIIANDAKRRKEWFEKTDQQTGFDTQDLLVAPMTVQDRTIGVIEVINKIDGAPFTLADQELLVTFSSQATIAIENARLYTLTDQALARRVEELSVMQRIDRELNATLDGDRAMKIALEWALRQSGFEAGLVGQEQDGAFYISAARGYPGRPEEKPDETGEAEADREPLVAGAYPALARALESGRPELVAFPDGEQDSQLYPASLPGVRQQIAVPFRSEKKAIAVMVLESARPQPCADEVLAFLSRLSDHATIALANARLYAQVKAANQAKSKFVSFVAHELKNPMTVIKGNTELVARGMAGPVTDLQASFLATVRSNVDRMNTIVSDLNDLTKIQVGALRLDFRKVQVQDTVAEVVRSLAWQIEEKKQVLKVELQAELPAVWADPGRLGQILTNLVSNAHKYTPEGGAITIAARQEMGGAGESGEGRDPGGSLRLGREAAIHLWVQDTGIGIAAEDQPKIFQSYFRTEAAKDAASGTGLGLNITRSLVEMQGGRIWFESRPGEGTIFHVTIPVAAVG